MRDAGYSFQPPSFYRDSTHPPSTNRSPLKPLSRGQRQTKGAEEKEKKKDSYCRALCGTISPFIKIAHLRRGQGVAEGAKAKDNLTQPIQKLHHFWSSAVHFTTPVSFHYRRPAKPPSFRGHAALYQITPRKESQSNAYPVLSFG